MLTKVGGHSCLKTEVGGKQGHALCKRQRVPKSYLMKKFANELTPSLQQLLNEQEVQKISRLHKFELRFGSFCGKGMKMCKQLKRKVDIGCLQEA